MSVDVIAGLTADIALANEAVNAAWVLMTGMGISGMQGGFLLLEVGQTQTKHVKSILMKNFVDFCFGAFFWYLVGYGLFTGDSPFAGGNGAHYYVYDETQFARAFQQYGFASTCITIVSGAIAGRGKFEPYLAFSCCMTIFIYPIIAHWAWQPGGWLYQRGFIDFAGSGVVHATGGIAAVIYAWMCGPRVGRFVKVYKTESEEGPYVIQVRELRGNNIINSMFGGLYLYVAWLSFNGGSITLSHGNYKAAARACFNTFLAAGASTTAAVLYTSYFKKVQDAKFVLNGMLVGLVAITAPCGYVEPWAAIVIGTVSLPPMAIVSWFVSHKLHIDDALDACAVHFAGGCIGVIATGLLANNGGLLITGDSALIVNQIIGLLAITGWSAGLTFLTLIPLHIFFGLSVPEEAQLIGMDAYYFDGFAFPDSNPSELAQTERERDGRVREVIQRDNSSGLSNHDPNKAKKVARIREHLVDKANVASMVAALAVHHEEEPVRFLDRLIEFERETNVSKRSRLARALVTEFVLETSAHQVNLSSKVRRGIGELYLLGGDALAMPAIFAEAKIEALKDLAMNPHVDVYLAKRDAGGIAITPYQEDPAESSFRYDKYSRKPSADSFSISNPGTPLNSRPASPNVVGGKPAFDSIDQSV